MRRHRPTESRVECSSDEDLCRIELVGLTGSRKLEHVYVVAVFLELMGDGSNKIQRRHRS